LAALANGTALRYLDFNAGYSGGRDSTKLSGLIPPVLAVAEAEGRSGKDLIAALVAACEVAGRLSEFAGDPDVKHRGWHHTCGLQFGCAAGAARLLSDDPRLTAEALAISGTHQNTLGQIQHGRISMIKATLLAINGLVGPDEIFEGHAGWASRVAGTVDFDGLLAPLDGNYRILNTRIKAFAVVGPAQSAVQAMVDLREEKRITPDLIKKIVVLLPERVVTDPAVTGENKRFPRNRETADHSYHYTAAIALMEGTCGEAQYAKDKLSSPEVRALIEKITLAADPEFSKNRSGGGGVRITLKDGSIHEKRHSLPPGHRDNPMSDAQLFGKFASQAGLLFDSDRTEAIKAAISDLEHCERVPDFTHLLVHP
jgi:2-methylcitrate dehydratase